jgi:hypothetical protein
MAKEPKDMDAKLMKELKDIRSLLILIALKLDATTAQVGKVLGVKPNTISTAVPLRKNKKGKK